ncbi:LORF2 protein, partial [Crocuta crocuta]
TSMFIAALLTIAKVQKESKCPLTDDWIKKLWWLWCTYTYIYIYTLMEYYLAIKMNEIFPFATMWMELECITLSKISQRKISII